MIFDCPACAAALRFDPATGKMKCFSCGNLYDVDSFDETSKYDSQTTSSVKTMRCKIYSCTACGAELTINNVESSTFCAYCGQPTIVLKRVSSAKRPKIIIPFSVTQEEAVSLIRTYMRTGFFIPRKLKHFKIEQVRGIYIPFWIYTFHYSAKHSLSGSTGFGKYKRTSYFYRESKSTFYDMTIDASHQLSDELSQKLEPFDLHFAKPFHPGYLSGFYADCYDFYSNELTSLVLERAQALFDSQIIKSVYATSVKILSRQARHQILKKEYSLLPVWFLTFRHKKKTYTILVNGQTGKVTGAVPFVKTLVIGFFILLTIITYLILYLLLYQILVASILSILTMTCACICTLPFCYAMCSYGFKKSKEIWKNIQLSKLSTINHFINDRQEDY